MFAYNLSFRPAVPEHVRINPPFIPTFGEVILLAGANAAAASLSPDFFRGQAVPAVRLAGLEHILHITALEDKIYLRSYRYRHHGDRPQGLVWFLGL